MKTRETTPGKAYSVHTSSGCTVSDKNGWSKTIDAPDGYFTAHAGEVTIDGDDAADVREVFKLAPQQRLALLGVLGGGVGLPAGYKRVEYLEGLDIPVNGAYIKLGRVFDYNKYEICASIPQGKKGKFFGSYILNSNYLVQCYFSSTGEARAQVGSQRLDLSDFTASEKLDFVIDLATGYVKVKNKAMTVTVGYTVNALKNIPYWIWGVSYDGQANETGPVRIYSFRESNNGKTLVNLVPCLDETGAPCVYDLVSRQPFYNAGTGDFLYPTESTTYALRRVLPDWGKLTEHGLRRLYHAPANYKGELYDYALENGYKPIVEPEQPETGYWAPRWTETEDEIVLEWVEIEPPADEFGLPEEDLT